MMTDRLLVYEFQSRNLDGSGWVTEWVTFVSQSDVRTFLDWVNNHGVVKTLDPNNFRTRRSTDLPEYTFESGYGLRRTGYAD